MRILLVVSGFLFLGLGAVGIVLPILPTTPFLMLSAFCFAKSSKKLHDWFLSTKIYKNHLDSFVKDRTMTKKTKLRILTSVTILLSICFIIVRHLLVAKLAIVIVWSCHVLYFLFYIKTTNSKEINTMECEEINIINYGEVNAMNSKEINTVSSDEINTMDGDEICKEIDIASSRQASP